MTETTDVSVWAYECPTCYREIEPSELPDDGRCTCEDSPKLREKHSEFGAGIVVCLAKFSEHLWIERERTAWELCRYKRDGKGELSKDAQRRLDFATEWQRKYPEYVHPYGDPLTYAIHDEIGMWANAAGDHFFDLDRERAPKELVELGDFMIWLRNDHLRDTQSVYGLAELERVRELWQAACIALDRMLGTKPNWGSW